MNKKQKSVVLITGAADRIGAAIARHLAGNGFDIVIHYHSSMRKAVSLAQKLKQDFAIRAIALRADLKVTAEREGLMKEARHQMGPLSALINNAAVFQPEDDSLEKLNDLLWQEHMEVNAHAPLHLSQLFAAQLPQKAKGNIVNLLDQRVWNLSKYFLSYTASKATLWTLTQTLALALAPRIRVNAIGPGMTLPAPGQSLSHFKQRRSQTPLQISADPDEIARAIGFILSSPSMTGQMIALDGGEHLVKKEI